MIKAHPFDVFKTPSTLYNFKIEPKGNRVLSVPDASEHALVNFQPIAKRPIRIAVDHQAAEEAFQSQRRKAD
jgi:hypothetical protein